MVGGCEEVSGFLYIVGLAFFFDFVSINSLANQSTYAIMRVSGQGCCGELLSFVMK